MIVDNLTTIIFLRNKSRRVVPTFTARTLTKLCTGCSGKTRYLTFHIYTFMTGDL